MRQFLDGLEWWLSQPANNYNVFMIAILLVIFLAA